MKNIKRVLAGVLCALLLVQGTPQMAIAMQIQDANQVTAKGAEYQDTVTDTETGETGEKENPEDENQTSEAEQEENSGEQGSVANTEKSDTENNPGDVANTENPGDSEKIEDTEKEDTESKEQNEQVEDTESTEVISTENVDDTELVESTDTIDTQGNGSGDAGIMLLDAGDNTDSTSIKINVKLAGAESGDTLSVKYKNEDAVAVDTTGKELTVTAGAQLELYITNLNGLKIKEVKWGAAGNEQTIATEITDSKIVIEPEQLVAGYNLIIEVEYYKFPICLKGATTTETLNGITLDGSATELTYPIDTKTEAEGKKRTFQLAGQTATEVPMYWSTEGARVVFGDMNGLKLEKAAIQYQNTQTDLSVKQENGCTINIPKEQFEKMKQDKGVLTIFVSVPDTFEVEYQNGDFLTPSQTLLNSRYGTAEVKADESGKTYLEVAGTDLYYAKQVRAENEPEANQNITAGKTSDGKSKIANIRFDVPENSSELKKLKFQMVIDTDNPTMTIEGAIKNEDGKLEIVRATADLFDIIVEVADTGSGGARVVYKIGDANVKNASKCTNNRYK